MADFIGFILLFYLGPLGLGRLFMRIVRGRPLTQKERILTLLPAVNIIIAGLSYIVLITLLLFKAIDFVLGNDNNRNL